LPACAVVVVVDEGAVTLVVGVPEVAGEPQPAARTAAAAAASAAAT